MDWEDLAPRGSGGHRQAAKAITTRTGRYRRALPRPAELTEVELAPEATLKQVVLRYIARQAESLHAPQEPSVSLGEHCSVNAHNFRAVTKPCPPLIGFMARDHVQPAPVALQILPEDLYIKERCCPQDHLLVLLVDASDSMGEGPIARMRAAKGAVLSWLRQAYLNRSHVALITFGGESAKMVLEPTRSLRRAQVQLERLPTGGATPFADGLYQAWRLIRRQKNQYPHRQPVLVIISDGEANVPLQTGMPVLPELCQLADRLRSESIAAVVLDVAETPLHSATLRQLAVRLRARYAPISGLRAHHVLKVIDHALGL